MERRTVTVEHRGNGEFVCVRESGHAFWPKPGDIMTWPMVKTEPSVTFVGDDADEFALKWMRLP